MKKLPFKSSSAFSLGAELEFQIIDPANYAMIPHAKNIIRSIHENQSIFQEKIKPEITQSMIEINSSIHQTPKQMLADLTAMHQFLLSQANQLGIKISGGGTHPFQRWTTQKIFPTKRFKNLSWQFRYLSKRSTVFGLHIHIGCPNGEDALYLTHALARYVPQFVVISASSPFYQGVDTGYQSSRSNVFSAFPLSGVMPYLTSWQEFSDYFYKMRFLKIIKTMKDFYWDIRPKPEFGTVEIRVFDTPLTIKKAVLIIAYIQAISHYLLTQKPFMPAHDLYYLYGYNRFQACRHGFDGIFVHPYTFQRISIYEDILETINLIEKHTDYFDSIDFILQLKNNVIEKHNDTTFLRKIFHETNSLPAVVREQCRLWEQNE